MDLDTIVYIPTVGKFGRVVEASLADLNLVFFEDGSRSFFFFGSTMQS